MQLVNWPDHWTKSSLSC